ELEHRVEPLALLDRRLGNRLRLLQAQPLVLARVEDRRMAEEHEPRARPHLEMTEPQLFVDQAQRFIDRQPLLRGDLDVGKSEELQDLVFRTPHAAKFVLRPASRRGGNDLTVAGSLASPSARLEILLENLD